VPLASMDHQRFSRVGETALSPERTGAWPHIATKEGVHGGTMGSPMLRAARVETA
jgi:hypothetical protein